MTAVVFGIALGCLIGGLLVCFLSTSVKQAMLQKVAYWIGIILVVFGVILIISPFLLWLNGLIRTWLGQ